MPLRELVKPETLQTMAAELFGFNPAMQARRDALRRLNVPTVVLTGDADTTASIDRHAAWLVHRMPRARLVRLPGVGHMPQHARPNEVMQAVDELAHSVDAIV
jgi:pimeloyl-ACP methyl ester carboxylesterase